MNDQENYILEIKETLGGLDEKAEESKKGILELKQFLLGNHQKGLIERQTITEGQVKQNHEDIQDLIEITKNTNETVKELTKIVSAHIVDDNVHSLKGLVLRKNVLIIIGVVFIILHTVIEDGGFLFELFKKLVGL